MASCRECSPVPEAEKQAKKIMQCDALFCIRWEGITDVLQRASLGLRILLHWASNFVYAWGMRFSVYHDSAKLMSQVAKEYETKFLWDDAAAEHLKLANCYLQLNNKSKAADAYFEAACCYLKTNMIKAEEAENCFMRAVSLCLEIGRHNMAASLYMELGKLQEKSYNLGMAIGFFQNATNNFVMEDNQFLATQCWLKIAEFSAQLDDYHGATEIYEDVALQEALSHHYLKDFYLDLAICHLCNGSVDAMQNAMQEYERHYWNAIVKDECRFLEHLSQAIYQDDPDKFHHTVNMYLVDKSMVQRRTWLLGKKEKAMVSDIERRTGLVWASSSSDDLQ